MKYSTYMYTQKPAKQDGNDTTTLSHHLYILCHFATMPCVLRRIVENNGVDSTGCVVYVMFMESEQCYGWLNTQHCRYGASWM